MKHVRRCPCERCQMRRAVFKQLRAERSLLHRLRTWLNHQHDKWGTR